MGIQWTSIQENIPKLVNSRSIFWIDRCQECIMSCLHLLRQPLLMGLWCFLRICRIHKASSVSLGTVRGTDGKTRLPHPQRRTTLSSAPSGIKESRVRSYTWFEELRSFQTVSVSPPAYRLAPRGHTCSSSAPWVNVRHSMRGNHGNGLPVQLYFP